MPNRPVDELDAQADKLGSYTLAGIRLELTPPFPATTELPPVSIGKSGRRSRIPTGHVRFAEPGAADNNLNNGYGMTERLTPEQIEINDAGLMLVREALTAAGAKVIVETKPSDEGETGTTQPTLF